MSYAARRGRGSRWARLPRTVLRMLWRILRAVLVVLGAALGPGMPPPPPPPPPAVEAVDTGGQVAPRE